MTGRGKLVAGPILILVGVLLLLGHSVSWNRFSFFWLIVLLAGGVGLLVLYSKGRKHPAVLSGGVLVTLVAAHMFALRWEWVSFAASWPFFLLAPGLALLAVAASDRQNKDALTPAVTLIGIACVCYLFTLGILGAIFKLILAIIRFLVRYLLPLGLIGWGVWLLVERRGQADDAPPPMPEKIEPDEPSPAGSGGEEDDAYSGEDAGAWYPPAPGVASPPEVEPEEEAEPAGEAPADEPPTEGEVVDADTSWEEETPPAAAAEAEEAEVEDLPSEGRPEEEERRRGEDEPRP